MKIRFSAGLLALVITIFFSYWSPTQATDVLNLLKQPGTHAIMRHALAPGTGDPNDFKLRDCNTQRNLDNRGREQAQSIGKALSEAGVVFDRVLSSQWCRCLDTASLLDLGDVEELAALNSFFENRSTADQQTLSIREFLTSLVKGESVMLVTHQVNITALTGQFPASGEVFLIQVDGVGQISVVGSFLLDP